MTPEPTPKEFKPALSVIRPESPEVQALITHLGAKQSGKYYVALCPAHEDHNPSLTFTVAQRGWVWMECRAGCPIDDVREALPEALRHVVRDGGWSPSPAKKASTKKTAKRGTPTDYYDYRDAEE